MCPSGGLLWRSKERVPEWFYKGRICSVPNATLTKMKGVIGKGKPPSWHLLGPREWQAHGRSILLFLYVHAGVWSLRGSGKTSCSRHMLHKVQVKVSSLHMLVISRRGPLSACHLELYPHEILQSVGSWTNPRAPTGKMQRRKALWALHLFTFQLQLTVRSPQRCLGPNNLIFTCRILCNAQGEETEANGWFISRRHSHWRLSISSQRVCRVLWSRLQERPTVRRGCLSSFPFCFSWGCHTDHFTTRHSILQ